MTQTADVSTQRDVASTSHRHNVTTRRLDRRDVTLRRNGATVWLTGLPSAGKSTLAHALAELLRAQGRLVEVLDGDEVRANLTTGLGFSREDRDTNVTRVGWVAELLARNGVIVLVPVIAPYAEARSAVRSHHDAGSTPYIEVHVATPLDVCEGRDVKGLYARQRAGDLRGLTGVDDPYEPPVSPELRLDTTHRPLEDSVGALLALLDGQVLR
jgi:adenylylsulfate kinase